MLDLNLGNENFPVVDDLSTIFILVTYDGTVDQYKIIMNIFLNDERYKNISDQAYYCCNIYSNLHL